jgi:hypothetical protein
MKILIKIFYLIFFLSSLSFGQTRKINNHLSNLIDSLYIADQSTVKIKPNDSAAAAYQRVIRTNFPFIKEILNRYGFPGFDIVGKEFSGKYFLLIQHSDFDVQFQKKALTLMKKQVDKKNASGQNYAYLIDRISLNTGKPQVYGTQVIMGRETKIRPCIDIDNLDKRRKSVGLIPIKEYLKNCNDTFYEMNPQEKRPKTNPSDSTKNGI